MELKNGTGTQNRIGYIDALRGFTMILVVINHVSRALRSETNVGFSFVEVFTLFFMPLFFFISGFLFYKAREWSLRETMGILLKKAKVQLLPTAFWGGLYVLIFGFSLRYALIEHGKVGYWFTIALFIFFVIYTLSELLVKAIKKLTGNRGRYLEDTVLAIAAVFVAGISFGNRVPFWPIHLSDNLYEAICGPQLWFYVYFVFGSIARKHFAGFQKLLDSGWFALMICLTLFGYTAYLKWHLETYMLAKAVLRPLLGLLGLIVVFAFFRRNEQTVCSGRVGNALSFIGRRTLDIYLLHYFFLPSSIPALQSVLPGGPTLDLIVSTVLALVIIQLCLIVSKTVRTSPLLAGLVFGDRSPKA